MREAGPSGSEFTATEPPGRSDSGRRATILVVEASPVQAELLRRALASAGYQVIVAGDGAEGLTLAKAHHYCDKTEKWSALTAFRFIHQRRVDDRKNLPDDETQTVAYSQ